MFTDTINSADDRVVVGYFAKGADASRAINELIDEGFLASEIGAAFRTAHTGMEVAEGGRPRGMARENPALSGSVGGPASHDEAVTPAGLAPGSGNAFPAPSKPGPIPGGGVPSTLRRDLPHDLPSIMRPEAEIPAGPAHPLSTAAVARQEFEEGDETRSERLRKVFGENGDSGSPKRGATLKFGTGEGHLFPDFEYSEPSFENSFLGMGLGGREARILSGQFSRGGAVVSITPGSRASLAEAIVERNHGRVRFDSTAMTGDAIDGSRVEIYGRMRNYYRPEEGMQRKAS